MNKVYLNNKSSNKFKSSNFNPADYVTVFADASHCPDTKASGWGGWCRYGDGGKFTCSGNMIANNSTEAELIGLQSMLNEVLNNVDITGKRIVIQCDNIGALEKLDIGLISKLALSVKLKHVKGHNGNRDPRSAVNTKCDRLARSEMLKLRDSLNG